MEESQEIEHFNQQLPETINTTATITESKSQSKPTTPRLSLKKFSRSSSTSSSKGISTGVGPNGFDFGKSKITSKNEVIKVGKEVEVKIESLKLGKDDQLKVVVMRMLFFFNI